MTHQKQRDQGGAFSVRDAKDSRDDQEALNSDEWQEITRAPSKSESITDRVHLLRTEPDHYIWKK